MFRLISLLALISSFSIQGECFQERLIGGTLAQPSEFKHVVYVKSVDGKHLGTCTGGILSPDLIITAGHCVIDEKTNEFNHMRMTVIAGTNDIKNPSNRGIEIPVQVVMVPESYNRLKGNYADVALLRLKQPLDLSGNKLAKLSLPTTKVADLKNPRFEFAGFGVTDSTYLGHRNYVHKKPIDGKLRKASMQLDKSCGTWSRSVIPKSAFCAKMINTEHLKVIGTCGGDSGGPLVQGTTVYGVTSFGRPSCNENDQPTVYTNVGDFTDFIKQALGGKTLGRSKTADKAGFM